jgi:hypothetical protein
LQDTSKLFIDKSDSGFFSFLKNFSFIFFLISSLPISGMLLLMNIFRPPFLHSFLMIQGTLIFKIVTGFGIINENYFIPLGYGWYIDISFY